MLQISEAANLFLSRSLCLLVTHFISSGIETGWGMDGFFFMQSERGFLISSIIASFMGLFDERQMYSFGSCIP